MRKGVSSQVSKRWITGSTVGYEKVRNGVQDQEVVWVLHREDGSIAGLGSLLSEQGRRQRSRLDLRHP